MALRMSVSRRIPFRGSGKVDSRFRGNDGVGLRSRSLPLSLPFPFYLTHTKAGRAFFLYESLLYLSVEGKEAD